VSAWQAAHDRVAETRLKRYMKRVDASARETALATKARPASSSKKTSTERVRKFRAAMRAKGLKPYTLWLPDTKDPVFLAECDETARKINESAFRKEDEGFMAKMWSEALAEQD
jgi:hypothetical protein